MGGARFNFRVLFLFFFFLPSPVSHFHVLTYTFIGYSILRSVKLLCALLNSHIAGETPGSRSGALCQISTFYFSIS